MLAQATGIYRERPIGGNALRSHFACVWLHQLPAEESSPLVIVPDGSIDLQWIGGSWRIAGPDREPQTEQLPAGTTVIGFRFRPAAAAVWLGVPASDILNRRVPLEDVWGSKARRMAEEVHDARHGRERETHDVRNARGLRDLQVLMSTLEHALVRDVPRIAPRTSRNTETNAVRETPTTPMHAMSAAFDLLSNGAPPATPLIPWLATNLAMSERTLRRRFDESFGYGPKTLDRILRFQRFLALIRSPRHASAATLAAEAGYADQAHLVRESRRLTAATPREIANLLRQSRSAG